MNNITYQQHIPKLNLTLQINESHDNIITAVGEKPHHILGLYSVFSYYAHYRNSCYMYNIPLYVMNSSTNNTASTQLDHFLSDIWKQLYTKKKFKINKNGTTTVATYKNRKSIAKQLINLALTNQDQYENFKQ